MAITSLFCAASFTLPPEAPALANFTPGSAHGDGWGELMTRSPTVASLIQTNGETCADLPIRATVQPPESLRANLEDPLTVYPACQSLDFPPLAVERTELADASESKI